MKANRHADRQTEEGGGRKTDNQRDRDTDRQRQIENSTAITFDDRIDSAFSCIFLR